jgi:hypothetical protein
MTKRGQGQRTEKRERKRPKKTDKTEAELVPQQEAQKGPDKKGEREVF